MYRLCCICKVATTQGVMVGVIWDDAPASTLEMFSRSTCLLEKMTESIWDFDGVFTNEIHFEIFVSKIEEQTKLKPNEWQGCDHYLRIPVWQPANEARREWPRSIE